MHGLSPVFWIILKSTVWVCGLFSHSGCPLVKCGVLPSTAASTEGEFPVGSHFGRGSLTCHHTRSQMRSEASPVPSSRAWQVFRGAVGSPCTSPAPANLHSGQVPLCFRSSEIATPRLLGLRPFQSTESNGALPSGAGPGASSCSGPVLSALPRREVHPDRCQPLHFSGEPCY